MLVAVTTRSTPGSTFRYVAEAPVTTGGGSGPGHDSASRDPGTDRTAAGPLPPPEKLTASPGTATGISRPPGSRRSRVSTGTQPLPRRTRTGSTAESATRWPSGSAVTEEVGVVRLGTATGFPDFSARRAAACALAWPGGPLPSSARFEAGGGCGGSGHALPAVNGPPGCPPGLPGSACATPAGTSAPIKPATTTA